MLPMSSTKAAIARKFWTKGRARRARLIGRVRKDGAGARCASSSRHGLLRRAEAARCRRARRIREDGERDGVADGEPGVARHVAAQIRRVSAQILPSVRRKMAFTPRNLEEEVDLAEARSGKAHKSSRPRGGGSTPTAYPTQRTCSSTFRPKHRHRRRRRDCAGGRWQADQVITVLLGRRAG